MLPNKLQPEDYYKDEELHGEYQYVSLKKIVDDFEYETMDDDSYLKHTKRVKIIKVVKDGILKLNKSGLERSRIFEVTVSEQLSVPLPHDYLKFVGASIVKEDPITKSYRLYPLNINNNLHSKVALLQDDNYELLFDHDGYILKADGYNHANFPHKKYQFVCGGDIRQISKHGELSVDEINGVISFSSDLYDQPIVIEYKTDGLGFDTYGEDDIKVHKVLLEVLKDWVYYSLIKYKRHVPQNEKHRALLRFKTTRHQAKLDRAKFNLIEIARQSRMAKS